MLLLNRIQTPDGTILTSRHTHDYVSYQDANGHYYAVDGGLSYQRIVGPSDYIDMSVTTADDFMLIRNLYEWGTYGPNGDQPLKYVKLCDLSDDHIENILSTLKFSDDIRNIFRQEQAYRKQLTTQGESNG